MTNPKTHWAMQLAEPSDHPKAWTGHAGGRYLQACGRKYCGDTQSGSAAAFVYSATKNPDWYCSDCARAARLSLAKESAPKPESPKQTGPLRPNCVDKRTDSDRYAELRALVESWQTAYHQKDKAQTQDRPITNGCLKHWLNFCDTQKPLLDWSHR